MTASSVGCASPPGDYAILLLASGNRDPEVFEDPEQFDITRTPNNHLGLGFGIHHCLGAPLARMESQVALASLVRSRTPDGADRRRRHLQVQHCHEMR